MEEARRRVKRERRRELIASDMKASASPYVSPVSTPGSDADHTPSLLADAPSNGGGGSGTLARVGSNGGADASHADAASAGRHASGIAESDGKDKAAAKLKARGRQRSRWNMGSRRDGADSSHSTPEPEPERVKLRVLCLHGWRTSADILKLQCQQLERHLEDLAGPSCHVCVATPHGPHPSHNHPLRGAEHNCSRAGAAHTLPRVTRVCVICSC